LEAGKRKTNGAKGGRSVPLARNQKLSLEDSADRCPNAGKPRLRLICSMVNPRLDSVSFNLGHARSGKFSIFERRARHSPNQASSDNEDGQTGRIKNAPEVLLRQSAGGLCPLERQAQWPCSFSEGTAIAWLGWMPVRYNP